MAYFKREEKEWIPLTDVGRRVKQGEITSIEDIFRKRLNILEPEIVDVLLPDLRKTESIDFKRTIRMNRNGRQPSFQSTIAVGNGNGYVGLGQASGQNGRAANVKATRKAKLNLKRVRRGCGSWECTCGEPHTVPFKVTGKCSSVNVELIPAPRGLGMKTSPTAKKILELAGISDAWIKTTGNTRSSPNFAKALLDALNKTNTMKGSLTATGRVPPKVILEEPVKETALAEDLNIESADVKNGDEAKTEVVDVAVKEDKLTGANENE